MGRESLSLDVFCYITSRPSPPRLFFFPSPLLCVSPFLFVTLHMSDVLVHRVSAIAQLTY